MACPEATVSSATGHIPATGSQARSGATSTCVVATMPH